MPPADCSDINGDGVINVVDVVNLVGYVLGTSEFSDTQLCASDVNQDGLINILDIIELINIILSS